MAFIIFYILTLYAADISCDEIDRPNIVFVVGDDIGWDDISLHGSDQILTPNIDMLGYQGTIISNYYTDCQGTPSTSALFTGKYPMRMGTQGPSIGAGEDRGIPMSERLLPSHLKDLGYDTHLVGKWHLGNSREGYLPMNRGFDTFYGFTASSVDYYKYYQVEDCNNTEYFGLNLFHNFSPVRDEHGHLTNILTDHALNIIENHNTSKPLYLHLSHAAAHIGGGIDKLQATDEDLKANEHIAHPARKLFAGLVTGVDRSVGKIIAALSKKGILNNTVIVFVCDNGAQSKGLSRNYGSNLPLRGTKGSPWEGAVRSTAVLWHAAINPQVWKGLFHVTDWLPTLVAAAGGNITTRVVLDGINHWNSIFYDDEKPKRKHAIIAIDDLMGWGAFRDSDFKIIVGSVPNTCGYYGHELNKVKDGAPDYEKALLESQTSKIFTERLDIGLDITYALEKRSLCNLNKQITKLNDTAVKTKEFCVPNKIKGCLYNIAMDPEETQDLWDKYPEIVQRMTLQFRLLWSELVPRSPPVCDINSNPGLRDYVWWSWLKDDDKFPEPIKDTPHYPMKVSDEEFRYYVNLNLEALSEQLSVIMENMADTFSGSVRYILKL